MSSRDTAVLGFSGGYSAKQLHRVRDLLTHLDAARRAVRFYPSGHAAIEAAVSRLSAVINRFHEEGAVVDLTFYDGELVFGDQVMLEESILFDQLIRGFESRGVGALEITQGVSPAELTRAVTLLAVDSTEAEQRGGIARMFEEAQLPHVRVSNVAAIGRALFGGSEFERSLEAYRAAIELMRELEGILHAGRAIDPRQLRGAVRGLTESVLENRSAALELTGLKSYDEYTFYHSVNSAILSLALGSTFTEDPRFLASLGLGALLHDIGKMTISASLLNKPGALIPDEWEEIRNHPVAGARIVSSMSGIDMSSIVIVLEHHMRYDGGGYPSRTPVAHQHLASRIVAVADAYDAMTSWRSYSAARLQNKAMETLVRNSGTAFDPVLVRQFVNMMGVYPIRSVVQLSDGTTGVVVRPGPGGPLQPVVRVIASASGEMLEPQLCDLGEQDTPAVVRTLDPADLNIDIDRYLAVND